MQTLKAIASRAVASARSVATAALITATVLSLAACSAPRLQSQAEYLQQSNTCSTRYRSARSAAETAANVRDTLIERYFAAAQAAKRWSQLAANCATRFAEGTMRSAQAMAQQLDLGKRLGQNGTPDISGRLDAVTSLQLGAGVLAPMIVAEDRAGFATQVLTARGSGNGSLTLSDDHKAAAEQLMSLMNQGGSPTVDPRQKVYAVQQLIAHPDTITDSVNGINAPTEAVVEMDCAREELAALSKLDSKDNLNTPQPPGAASLSAISRLITAHALQAFILGYPSFDGAVFD